MTDQTDKIQWHPGFCSAAELELIENKTELEFIREYNIGKEPLRIDLLIIKKRPGAVIKNEIGSIFKQHNLLEYKSPDDGFSIDDYYKAIGYACIYKSFGETVDAIPAQEITVSFFREAYPRACLKNHSCHLHSPLCVIFAPNSGYIARYAPFIWHKSPTNCEIHLAESIFQTRSRELIKSLVRQGLSIEEKYPGIYYVKGRVLFYMQIIVMRELQKHSGFKILSKNAREEDVRCFLETVSGYTKQGDKNNADAVLQVSVMANKKLYQAIRRDFGMCEALKELMKDEIDKEADLRAEMIVQIKVQEAEKKYQAEIEKKVQETEKKVQLETEKTKQNTMQSDLNNLMENTGWTKEKAMKMLGISFTD